ncbi:hypothetical protein DVH24_015004 [Malus domestica]|uniref:Uncharacterized protein n=1 Tax=Malus domestica TaxID=3750 RepID=A0A498K6Y8_MALDO|nr:hypothetical protein DVH24_015004 [Malus domestica]
MSSPVDLGQKPEPFHAQEFHSSVPEHVGSRSIDTSCLLPPFRSCSPYRKQPQTNKSIFSISLRIAVSLSLTASSSTNLNRSRTTNPSRRKTYEEILVVGQQSDCNIPTSNHLRPFYLKALSPIYFVTVVEWETRKSLVMERVKVAPPKAMEIRVV